MVVPHGLHRFLYRSRGRGYVFDDSHDSPRSRRARVLATARCRSSSADRGEANRGLTMMSYEILRVIWWLILGVLLIGFAVTDGFDMGVGAIFRFIGRTDDERRALLESIEPVWEGNQVWFILGGGAVFAAWPLLYAASFSGLYLAMFLLLVALILRPVGFTFRGKMADPRWRSACDWALLVSGVVPPLLFGVAFGNLFIGVPFHFDAMM